MKCFRWSISDVSSHGIEATWPRSVARSVTHVPGLFCYPCPWTEPSGSKPDLSLRSRILAVLYALGCTFVSAACESRHDLIQQAEARRKLWGYPAPRIVQDL